VKALHEMALVSSIFNILNAKIEEYKINKVLQVKLMVGAMTGVEDATMRNCFELFAENTPVEGAGLVIERIPIKAQCCSCGREFIAKGWDFQCPDCRNIGVRIISGKELYIDSIEAE
jgi:hydrogenase nickel incorporation protein HypA/HybF